MGTLWRGDNLGELKILVDWLWLPKILLILPDHGGYEGRIDVGHIVVDITKEFHRGTHVVKAQGQEE